MTIKNTTVKTRSINLNGSDIVDLLVKAGLIEAVHDGEKIFLAGTPSQNADGPPFVMTRIGNVVVRISDSSEA